MSKYYDIDDIIADEEVNTGIIPGWIFLLATPPSCQSNTGMLLLLTGCLSHIPKGSKWSGNRSQF